jgi:Na+-transporting NADH:ubiquinone oxidoreductase subunit NqrB
MLFPSQLWPNDPRYYQITVLSSLLIYGTGWLAFDIQLIHTVIIIFTALLTQLLCIFWLKLPLDWRSPLISALSLCLLLRTNSLLLASLAAAITILSKFTLRWKQKHIFNPTNFGLVTMMLISEQVWVSPGQWGSGAFFGFLLACVGGLVIYRATRSEVTYAFLVSYLILLSARAGWLGDPLAIPLHQLESGALLLFAFFMISDPKTTPNSKTGRIIFGFLVAMGAGFVQFWLYEPNGLLWSLAFFSLWVPLLDWHWPGKRYEW